MSIKLMMEVNRAHERIDALLAQIAELTARLEKCEGEIKAMKARAGKTRELSEI